MRVLLLVHGYPPLAQGGSEIYAEAHARALRRHFGDEILVLTREHDPRRPEYSIRNEERDGIRVARINNTFRDTRRFEQTYLNETIDALAADVIDEFRPDVAHIHHLTCLSTGIVQRLAMRRIPRYLTLHDYWLICHRGQLLDARYRLCENVDRGTAAMCASCIDPATSAATGRGGRLLRTLARQVPASAALLRRGGRTLATFIAAGDTSPDAVRRTSHMREVCANITHFVAPCRYIRDRFVAFGVGPERISVADFGFDHAAFAAAPRTTTDRRLRVGFLGSLMISKAPHVLLEAVRALPPDALSVAIYGTHTAYHGDDSYRERLAPLLAQSSVVHHGPLPHAEVPQALASLDVLVVPSIWPENSPLVIREAFLAGLPVVASRVGGIPELVIDEVNGLLFRPGDAEDLARALARLVNEPGLLTRLRNGMPAVRSIETDVRELRAMYQQALPPV